MRTNAVQPPRLMKVKDMMLEEERQKFEEKRAAREAERAAQPHI